MLRSRWTPGEAAGVTGTVLVSVTDFRADRLLDLPGVYRAGLALRRSWPELPGAVGMWLWTEPLSGRCGSVSIWRDELALRRFVAWPDHVAIVRRYRGRGRLRSTTWTTAQPDPGLWDRARAYLSEAAGTP
ncbi:hypothetical protein GCM10010149_11410 [Nonomuraea roseoviolacea subsp. roseoviolacea]|uniref:DUF3291 domain-containing protein n=1 Tax=Nonomuraea roseoviolacea subsp. carminata TaxID=160689 RepID=A0ABT1KAN4_9ACTN|nr:hypothetical protein [Nonomuraea roseoviolacea]MCP2351078.1 hypothetical protein [Nonomuraea roseoviolacea subsp. carminata]